MQCPNPTELDNIDLIISNITKNETISKSKRGTSGL